MSVLIIGAAGAIGRRLCQALTARGTRVVASDRTERLPASLRRAMGARGTWVGGIDVRDAAALRALFRDHADEDTLVWNLAAPLSIETAADPASAAAITVGGMENVLDAMRATGTRRICFTDSIASFGASAPRRGTTARWLRDNPAQDPGSDYGRQKAACRRALARFARDTAGGDARFAVLPGVLHGAAAWGNGTTEYALDALRAAPHQAKKHGLPAAGAFRCPVDPDVRLPMIHVDDLLRGLIALQEADARALVEPERGYCLPGLSFSPRELFAEIRKHYPGFEFRVDLDANMNRFAHLWPDELGTTETLRDLGYSPRLGLSDIVSSVLAAHERRNARCAAAFGAITPEGAVSFDRAAIEEHVRTYLACGREDYAARDAARELAGRLMDDLDADGDGIVSWGSFSEWSRRHSMEEVLRRQARAVEKTLREQIRELGGVPRA